MLESIIYVAVAFLLGAVPTGFILGLLHGVDLRKEGSCNIGATNAKRVLGPKIGLYTLLGDILKGVAALYLPAVGALVFAPVSDSAALVPLLGLAAIVGHCFSPFLGCNGGKGVATSLGVFVVIATFPTVIAIAVFGAVVRSSGFVSLGSIASSVSLFATVWGGVGGPYNQQTFLCALLGCGLVVARHHENISRLLKGTENRLFARRAAS